MIEVSNIISAEKYLDGIVKSINNITYNEFKLNGYKYEEKKFVMKEKSTIRNDIETNIIRGKINKKCYEKIKKDEAMGKKIVSIQTIPEIDINILTDAGIFNIVKDKSKLVEWKKLKLEVKIKKLKEFIEKKYENFPEEMSNKLIELIEKNKINFKKYIGYDSILERILQMPIIEYDNIMGIYKINFSNEKKSKRKKKISLK